MQEVIGSEFEGVLVSNFYASYNTNLGFHQRCRVHRLRDIQKLVEAYPHHPGLLTWPKEVRHLYLKAKAYPGPDPEKFPSIREQQQQRWQDQRRFRNQLLQLCQPFLNQEVPQQTLCQRIDKYQDELFLFVVNPQVPADNSSA